MDATLNEESLAKFKDGLEKLEEHITTFRFRLDRSQEPKKGNARDCAKPSYAYKGW